MSRGAKGGLWRDVCTSRKAHVDSCFIGSCRVLDLELYQRDVKTSSPHGELYKSIHMKIPHQVKF